MSHTAPPDWRWQRYATLASTQDVAVAAARAGDPGWLAVLAERQTSGRGSRGRSWVSLAKNLNLSVLLRPGHERVEPGRWALLAGVAVHGALTEQGKQSFFEKKDQETFVPAHLKRPHTSCDSNSPEQKFFGPFFQKRTACLPEPPSTTTSIMLKWPNDVLLDGAKLGGVLIDSHVGASGAADWVVIGVGVNLGEAPVVEGRRVASLPGVAASDVAEAVVSGIAYWSGRETAEICAAWLERAHPVGTMLDVRTPQRHLTGAFAGLTPSGQLLLEGFDTPISSAEIFMTRELDGALGETSGVCAAPRELPTRFLPCS